MLTTRALLVFGIIAFVGAQLDFTSTNDGTYAVTVSGKEWLKGSWSGFHSGKTWYSTQDKSLALKKAENYSGSDAMGAFRAVRYTWSAIDKLYITTIKSYPKLNAVTFTQSFPNGLVDTALSTDDVVSVFPSFEMPSDASKGFAGVSNQFLKDVSMGIFKKGATLPGGMDGSGPLLIFEEDLNNVAVFSSLSNFMAASWTQMNDVFVSGIMGTVTNIPAGFELETILVLDQGINDAMNYWGSILLNRYNKVQNKLDYALNYLGYNTDHGAYYYYHTENNTNYEQTLFAYQKYAEAEKIPFKWILLDSWWYLKGIDNGVKNWTVRPDVFPHGMRNFRDVTGWPIMGHNRFWASDNIYAKQNGGDFDFNVQAPKAIPLRREFWDYLMSTSAEWGLMVYEQDWLHNEFAGLNITLQDPTMGRKWLLEMGYAAEANDITIQYCMPWARHVLQSVEIQAVTHVRSTDDHLPGNQEWKQGYSSMILHALGMAPFKDNFWTTEHQPNSPYGSKASEPYTKFESCIATFSTGPVTPADKIGYTDRQLVMKSCMNDGTLLQPSKPLTMVDATFAHRAFTSAPGPDGELWSTHTAIGQLRFHHVLGVDITTPYKVVPSTLTRKPLSGEYMAFKNPEMGKAPYQLFSEKDPITIPTCGQGDFNLWHICPVLPNGWVLIGETNKWVPVSEDRVISITYDDESITVNARGTPGEAVGLSFVHVKNGVFGAQITPECVVPEEGTFSATVTTSSATGTCNGVV